MSFPAHCTARARPLGPALVGILACACALGALAPSLNAQGRVPVGVEARVDALFAVHSDARGPGLAIAVVRDGRMVLSRGYGLADIEHGVPITGSTVFDVASVSKQFTGLAVAMLVEQGKLDLSADVTTYIPEMKVHSARVRCTAPSRTSRSG